MGGSYDTTGGYYGLLWKIKTAPQSGNPLQEVKYTWDANGNLTQRDTDYPTDETETFTYDFLDRLTAVSGAYSQSFSYNTIGNITSMNGNSYNYGDSNHKHAVTSVGSTSYSYDANGNMTTRGNQTITWDVDNMVKQVTDPNNTSTFVYDGNGARVKKTEANETIIYVNQYYEKNLTTGEVTTCYYLGGKLVANRVGTTLSYVHQDSLGSTSITTDSSGSSLGSISYFPYGGARSSSGTLPDQKFTGQRLDDTGLYYYNARYYDSIIGRFISPDSLMQIAPIRNDMQLTLTVSYAETNILTKLNQALREGNYYKGGLSDPQLLNRYSHARNNPLKYRDSSGHWIWAIVGAIIGGVVGFGAYAITHNDKFNWGEAAIWAGTGALIGTGFGWLVATYGPAIAASTSPWLLPVFQRGQQIEDMLGRNLARNFPVIDKWINGVATSIKSIDITCKTYQNMNNLIQLVKGYANQLASFQGVNWAGISIKASDITSRVLQLAIPEGATEQQLNTLRQLVEWAKSIGVTIKVTVVK